MIQTWFAPSLWFADVRPGKAYPSRFLMPRKSIFHQAAAVKPVAIPTPFQPGPRPAGLLPAADARGDSQCGWWTHGSGCRPRRDPQKVARTGHRSNEQKARCLPEARGIMNRGLRVSGQLYDVDRRRSSNPSACGLNSPGLLSMFAAVAPLAPVTCGNAFMVHCVRILRG